MIIEINNTSRVDAEIQLGKKFVKLSKGKSLTLCETGNSAVIGIHPRMNTSFSRYASNFVVLSEFKIDNEERVTMNIDYQTASAKCEANHIYYRFAEISGRFKAFYSILPEKKQRHDLGMNFLLNLPLTLIFEGIGIVILSLIVWWITGSMSKALIAFFVLLMAITLYEVFENIILDRLFDGMGKKSSFFKRGQEPVDFKICSESDYIDQCFNNP